MKKKIENVKDLTADLVKHYESLTYGKLSIRKAKEISNLAGKIINSAKANLDYNSYMKFKREISFLDVKEIKQKSKR